MDIEIVNRVKNSKNLNFTFNFPEYFPYFVHAPLTVHVYFENKRLQAKYEHVLVRQDGNELREKWNEN